MASAKRFVNNLGFYALGTFATKLLQFLFVPIYSKFIDPAEMGTYSVSLATISFALPVLFQSIWEGTFRFIIEEGDDGRRVLATSSKYCLALSLLYTFAFIVVSYTLDLRYGVYILLYAIGQVGVMYWQFAARALKANKAYAASSVIFSSVSILLNLVLILIFHLGIEALFVASIAGSLSMVVYLEFKLHLLADINKYPFNKALLKQIIKYSTPLAINTVSWWLMSSCNNIIITTNLGAYENGIYAIAMKYGMILSVVTSVITLAWQEEAFRTYGEADQDAYFNKVLDLLTKGLFGVTIALIPLTYIIYIYMVFGEYQQGVLLVAFIYLSAIYNAIACHLGSALLARKESGILFYTTLFGGIINVIVSFILVNYIGILGAVIGSAIGNMFNFYVRIPILRERISLVVNYTYLIPLTIGCVLTSCLCAYFKTDVVMLSVIFLAAVLLFGLTNRQLLVMIELKLIKKIQR